MTATHIEIVTITGITIVAPRLCIYLHADNESGSVEYTAAVTGPQGHDAYDITKEEYTNLAYLLTHTNDN